MFLGSVRSLFKFRVQSAKNIDDVREVFLRMYLCVFLCLDEFYMFVALKIGWDVPMTYMNSIRV